MTFIIVIIGWGYSAKVSVEKAAKG